MHVRPAFVLPAGLSAFSRRKLVSGARRKRDFCMWQRRETVGIYGLGKAPVIGDGNISRFMLVGQCGIW